MSGAIWFLVVVIVSVVVSGSVGVILNVFLGDSKENVSEGEDRGAGKRHVTKIRGRVRVQ